MPRRGASRGSHPCHAGAACRVGRWVASGAVCQQTLQACRPRHLGQEGDTMSVRSGVNMLRETDGTDNGCERLDP
eukprot:2748640-Prymnesium_polylepis.1